MQSEVIRLKPFEYIHILDNNSNVTCCEVGPLTITRKDHEKIVGSVQPMIVVPPRHYCIIANPVKTQGDGTVSRDKHGQYMLRQGEEEVRYDVDPFPLYPGEVLKGKVTPFLVVGPNNALRLAAIRDFEEGDKKYVAGDEWLFHGKEGAPVTYIPRVEVRVVEEIAARIIYPNTALRVKARRDTPKMKAGEERLERTVGAYLPSVDEEVVRLIEGVILTDEFALHLRASRSFKDIFDVDRKAGEEWLVTRSMTECHIPDVNEEVVGQVYITVLSKDQFCVVVDPIDSNGKQQFGKREVRRGCLSFFLKPHEHLEAGVQNVYVLADGEALLLIAREKFNDKENGKVVTRMPGEKWLVVGTCEYVPPVEVSVVEKRTRIPLAENEGIYVRDVNTGRVRTEIGKSYLLKANEELWEKELPPIVEELYKERVGIAGARDKTRVVSYRSKHNTAVQVYDYKAKDSRVVIGPALVALGPDEHFTLLSLSGGKPKVPHQIKSIELNMGPDFMTDIINVDTADHARLSLRVSYQWQFQPEPKNLKAMFSVPDFVGDSCKVLAARIRAAVALKSFDSFHKNSAEIILKAVFDGKENCFFKDNCLIINNVDVRSVEPVDQRTRDSLQKSVQLAIEITTRAQEANARHEAEKLEALSKGKLERQKIADEALAEECRTKVLELQSQNSTIEGTGKAVANARAQATAAEIESQAAIEKAKNEAEAKRISMNARREAEQAKQELELAFAKEMAEIEVQKEQRLAAIETLRYTEMVNAIGRDTIAAIADAGPKLQSALLNGLGLKSMLITDGNAPINLFSAANGLIAAPTASSH